MTGPQPPWANRTPSTDGVHNEPPRNAQWTNMEQQAWDALRSKFMESILQVIVQDLTGVLFPGPAGVQLANWTLELLTTSSSIAASAITGVLTLAQIPVTVL